MKKNHLPLISSVIWACKVKGDDLTFSYETQDAIPEAFRSIYKEEGGKFVLNVAGAVSVDNVTRLQNSLSKERNDHKDAKGKWSPLADIELSPADIRARLDEYEVLKLQADPDKQDAVFDAKMKAALSPVQRQLSEATTKVDELTKQNAALIGERNTNHINAEVRKQATALGIRSTALDDAMRYVRDVCQLTDEGRIVTKAVEGFDEYTDLDVVLKQCVQTRPHWFETSQGGGSRGTTQSSGGAGNPWAKASWNITEQARMIAKDRGKAEQMAKLAGASLINLPK